jgi:hypothetical protein
MARSKLFEYIILYHPKNKKDKDGNDVTEKTKLIGASKSFLGKDEREVSMVAAREIPEKYLHDLERVEIVIRPF